MNKISSIFLRFFGLILFVYILSRIDFFQLSAEFQKMNFFYCLVGFLFLVLTFFIRALRWKMLVNSTETEISFWALSKILAKGVFLGLITPGKIGEFWQAKYLSDKTGTSWGRGFYTIFMDRMTDLLTLGIIGFAGIMVVFLKFGLGGEWLAHFLLFILVVFAISYFLTRKIGLKRILKFLIKFLIPSSLKEKTEFFLTELKQGFQRLNSRLAFNVMGLAFLSYCIGAFSHYLVALALGISIPFWYFFLIVGVVWLFAALPITFLGLGTREVGFIYFFSIFGVVASSAVALSLIVLFFNILIVMPGAIMFLIKK